MKWSQVDLQRAGVERVDMARRLPGDQNRPVPQRTVAVYPVLNRLEADGRVRSEWREGDGGPGRKFYSITPAGETWLSETSGAWQDFTARVAAILTIEGNPS